MVEDIQAIHLNLKIAPIFDSIVCNRLDLNHLAQFNNGSQRNAAQDSELVTTARLPIRFSWAPNQTLSGRISYTIPKGKRTKERLCSWKTLLEMMSSVQLSWAKINKEITWESWSGKDKLTRPHRKRYLQRNTTGNTGI